MEAHQFRTNCIGLSWIFSKKFQNCGDTFIEQALSTLITIDPDHARDCATFIVVYVVPFPLELLIAVAALAIA